MVTRGLWNLQINGILTSDAKSIQVCLPCVAGKWFRYCHPQARTSSPGDEATFQKIKQLQEAKNKPDGWEEVSFPSPPHSVFRIKLAEVHEAPDLSFESLLQKASRPLERTLNLTSGKQTEHIVSGDLEINFDAPTPLNELQFRFFTDFIFQWRFYIDDHTLWQYPSTLLNTLVIAVLRLAAWDLEITHEDIDSRVELPIGFRSVPGWDSPETHIFWFHGFLVVICDTLDTNSSVTAAVLRAKTLLNGYSRVSQKARLILVSLRHVQFVELSPEFVGRSEVLPLVVNTSAEQCSPGFRALTHVLSSSCWKESLAHRERWGINMPPEIFDMILRALTPRDILSFCRSSLAVERWYYSSVPQFGDFRVRHFDSSVPCCGQLDAMDAAVCCSLCYVWKHTKCIGLACTPPGRRYICPDCHEKKDRQCLVPGGINETSGRKWRGPGCRIRVAGHPKILELRLSLPTHLRPERRLLGTLDRAPSLFINYAIRFGGAFSGLAYGLDEDLCQTENS
ncbi:Pc15g00950 [Penicillium rubens Wisconsin 54-1255]|uniref:Pc15g00950 protein n=1 Tax=Penicillium rubens (strain ATCC 28089 / DSM 1075 / NRRL 1951 / Wisconsin 54-1255) TaxID=500485 RepID=B6H6N9_PENRW|nr:Pc15g00950 [Penicillium rubens Wisconsin 54-1255]